MSRSFRHQRPDVRQEEDVVPPGPILAIGFGLIAFTFALALWAYGVLRSTERELRPSDEFPEKHLVKPDQVSQVRQDVFGARGAAELYEQPLRAELHTWGWVDARKQVVRVPIDVAMRLVARGKK